MLSHIHSHLDAGLPPSLSNAYRAYPPPARVPYADGRSPSQPPPSRPLAADGPKPAPTEAFATATFDRQRHLGK